MAAPNPYAGTDDDFDPYTDWKELVANYSPAGGSMFSRKSGEASLVGMVDARKARAACRYMLGYAAVGGTAGAYTLQRTPPVFHPKYPSMICHSVADEEFKVYPSVANSLKYPADNAGLDGARSLLYRARYKKSRLTLRFEPAMWPVLGDGEMVGFGEWKRYCYVNQEPRVEVLSLDGFQMVFFEGSGCANPITNPAGKAVPSDVGQILVKSDIQVVWDEVPENWVMATAVSNGISITPTKILAGLGCVNKYNWNGYLAGTLLLNGVRFTRHPWPLFAGTESRYIYTIEFLMSFFDPPKGYTGSGSGFTQLNRIGSNGEPLDPRGHICLPYQGASKPTAGDKNAGRWFAASFTGGSDVAANKRLYDQYDYAKLFDCARNP
jgi:hypothetical protein